MAFCDLLIFMEEDVRRGERIAQSTVWKVYKGSFGDNACAIKRLKSMNEQDKNIFRSNVLQECYTWSILDNPHIVKLHGIYYSNRDPGVPSLLLELLDKSLTDHLNNTSGNRVVLFPVQSKWTILLQVAKALKYLHCEKSVIHGDLTTNNVLLKEDSPGCFTAKLTDFGMSRVVEDCNVVMSTGYGTHVYMPPEVHNASQEKTTKVDIYSFGVLGIHTVTHKFPRPSYACRVDEAGKLVAVDEFRRYSHLLYGLSAEEKLLDRLWEACIQYHPEKRLDAISVIEHVKEISDSSDLKSSPNGSPPTMRTSANEDDDQCNLLCETPITNIYINHTVRDCHFSDSEVNIGSSVCKHLCQTLNELPTSSHSESLEECDAVKDPMQLTSASDENLAIKKTEVKRSGFKRVGQRGNTADSPSVKMLDGEGSKFRMERSKGRLQLVERFSNAIWTDKYQNLEGMYHEQPTAVFFNQKIYLGDRYWPYKSSLDVLHLPTRKWTKLPFYNEREMCGFTMSVCTNHLHVISGHWRKGNREERYTSKVFSIDDRFDTMWFQTLPPLAQGRTLAISTAFGSFLVVGGGLGDSGQLLSSVEVIDTSQPSPVWWKLCDLPVKSYLLHCTTTDKFLFMGLGVYAARNLYMARLTDIKTVVSTKVPSEHDPNTFWKPLPKENPFEYSGLVTVNNCIITVCGRDKATDGQCQSSLHLYDFDQQSWLQVSHLVHARSSPAVCCVRIEDKTELIVFCGWGATKSIESCELPC